MATKLNWKEKRDLVKSVYRPFKILSEQVSTKHRATLVQKWVREELAPRVQKWEEADPQLFKYNASSMGSVQLDGIHYALPSNRRWPSHLPENMVEWNYIMNKFATEGVREELNGAILLEEKARQVDELLTQFLGGEGDGEFNSMEQVIFSLPEIKSFAPAKCQSQKRPRVFKVPPAELVRLMREAVRLKEALGANGQS